MGVGHEKQRFLSLAQLVEEGTGGMVVSAVAAMRDRLVA